MYKIIQSSFYNLWAQTNTKQTPNTEHEIVFFYNSSNICDFWTTGNVIHFTSDHKSKEELKCDYGIKKQGGYKETTWEYKES